MFPSYRCIRVGKEIVRRSVHSVAIEIHCFEFAALFTHLDDAKKTRKDEQEEIH